MLFPSFIVVQTEDSEPVTKLDIVEFSKRSEALINLLQENNQQEIALQILLFVSNLRFDWKWMWLFKETIFNIENWKKYIGCGNF